MTHPSTNAGARRAEIDQVDILIRGGTVIAQGEAVRADIALAGGRIVAIEPDLTSRRAGRVIDATGAYVTSGFIDLHTHVFAGVGESADADEVCLPRGTTTAVDAGTAGARTFGAFRRLAAASTTRILSWLNLSTIGQADTRVPELMADLHMDVAACIDVVQANPDMIVGIKARLSTYAAGISAAPLRRLAEVAEATGLPTMVHIGDTPITLPEILETLRPGDVVTHTFTGRHRGVVGADGQLLSQVQKAQDNGIFFDVGRGRNHVSFPVLRAAFAEGFLPDSLSTDITEATAADPAFALPMIADYLLALDVPVADVLHRLTAGPASIVKRPELATVSVGAAADLTVCRVVDGPRSMFDTDGRAMETRRSLSVLGCVRNGTWVASEATTSSAPPAASSASYGAAVRQRIVNANGAVKVCHGG